MPAPAGTPSPSRGLVLVHGSRGHVEAWVRRGLVAAHVLRADGWTAVCPAEQSSRVSAPYDDALSVLAARPFGTRLRPAFGVFVIDDKAVVTVQPGGRREPQRWLVWAPGRGVLRSARLTPARPEDLLRACGAPGSASGELARVLGSDEGTPLTWVLDLMAALRLPGRRLVTEPGAPGGRLVEPDRRSVARFEALMAEDEHLRREHAGAVDSAPPGRTDVRGPVDSRGEQP